MKGSAVESIEEARKEYKKLLEEEWAKAYKLIRFSEKRIVVNFPKIWHFMKIISR